MGTSAPQLLVPEWAPPAAWYLAWPCSCDSHFSSILSSAPPRKMGGCRRLWLCVEGGVSQGGGRKEEHFRCSAPLGVSGSGFEVGELDELGSTQVAYGH